MLKEAHIIEKLQNAMNKGPRGVHGIGDDASVFPLNDTISYVISKDLLVEDTHFRLRYFDPGSLSHKALHVNLSDLAAMGAIPHFVLLGLSIPQSLTQEWIDRFLEEFVTECKKLGVYLIGGDTTASQQGLFISVTVIGQAQHLHLKFRHGAKPGDLVCIAGHLGEADAGLMALEKEIPGFQGLKAQALRPEALIQEGIWMGRRPEVTAMMDISDGLYIDLSRLCQSSRRGAIIELSTLQPSKALQEGCQKMHLDPLQCMLTGGEDYALLVTIAAEDYSTVARDFKKRFGYPLITIGNISKDNGIKLTQGGVPTSFSYTPFSHFKEFE
jgi:thiamine-monophosphate kinase